MNVVETVIINWKRPANIEKIITALRSQTVPCTVTLCDCHPSAEYALSAPTLEKVDRIYRWKHNLGAYSRYLPMIGFDHPYTFLIDDDLLPGCQCLEAFLEAALQIENEFGVLGQFGRIVSAEGYYRAVNIPRNDRFREVDFIVQAYFVKTCNLHNLLRFRWETGYFEDKLPEDDLLLCASLKYYQDLRCYLTPWNGNPETLLNQHVLDESFALSSRKDHYYRRQKFIDRITCYGWKSLHITGERHNYI